MFPGCRFPGSIPSSLRRVSGRPRLAVLRTGSRSRQVLVGSLRSFSLRIAGKQFPWGPDAFRRRVRVRNDGAVRRDDEARAHRPPPNGFAFRGAVLLANGDQTLGSLDRAPLVGFRRCLFVRALVRSVLVKLENRSRASGQDLVAQILRVPDSYSRKSWLSRVAHPPYRVPEVSSTNVRSEEK